MTNQPFDYSQFAGQGKARAWDKEGVSLDGGLLEQLTSLLGSYPQDTDFNPAGNTYDIRQGLQELNGLDSSSSTMAELFKGSESIEDLLRDRISNKDIADPETPAVPEMGQTQDYEQVSDKFDSTERILIEGAMGALDPASRDLDPIQQVNYGLEDLVDFVKEDHPAEEQWYLNDGNIGDLLDSIDDDPQTASDDFGELVDRYFGDREVLVHYIEEEVDDLVIGDLIAPPLEVGEGEGAIPHVVTDDDGTWDSVIGNDPELRRIIESYAGEDEKSEATKETSDPVIRDLDKEIKETSDPVIKGLDPRLFNHEAIDTTQKPGQLRDTGGQREASRHDSLVGVGEEKQGLKDEITSSFSASRDDANQQDILSLVSDSGPMYDILDTGGDTLDKLREGAGSVDRGDPAVGQENSAISASSVIIQGATINLVSSEADIQLKGVDSGPASVATPTAPAVTG